jgi:hypothetical protein
MQAFPQPLLHAAPLWPAASSCANKDPKVGEDLEPKKIRPQIKTKGGLICIVKRDTVEQLLGRFKRPKSTNDNEHHCNLDADKQE